MNVNQNDIRTNLFDILIGNHDIRLTVEKIQHLITPRNHDLTDTAAALVKLQVAHLPKLLAIPDIDHILTLQF